MPIIDALLPEFDHEIATTRKLLERLPDDKFDWKPHAKSFALGALATHVATIPMWGEMALTRADIQIRLGAHHLHVRQERRGHKGRARGQERRPDDGALGVEA